MIAPEVGGGFGVKISCYQEDILCAAIALRLKQPIKWIESRSEHMATTHHGRAHIAEVSLAAKKDGTITAIKLRLLADLGAYPRGAAIPTLTALLMNGIYDVKSVDLEVKGIYTNTMATGAYRGAGRPEAAYYLERITDVLADELGMDPGALRRKNFIPPDAFPYQTAAGPQYDSGDYEKPLAKALELSNYTALRAEQEQLRKEGRYLGIGVVTFTEICGFGPFDSATVRVEPTGQVTVTTGVSPHGQGPRPRSRRSSPTSSASRWTTSLSSTATPPAPPPGSARWARAGSSVGGSALMGGLGKVREKAIKIAAHKLEAAEGDVSFENGKFGVKGAPEGALDIKAIAKIAYSGSLPPEIGSGLEVADFFAPPGTTFRSARISSSSR